MKTSIFYLTLAIATGTNLSRALAIGKSETPRSFELKYFDARGAAETSRIIFAIADEEYIDTRYEITPGTMVAPDFVKAKERGELDMNLARAPLLVADSGAMIGQSKAIERFLAKKFGLMGSSDIEAAQIDCIAEHCRDVQTAQRNKGFSFFNREKSEEEKAAARKEWFETDMPTMLEKIEKSITLTSAKSGFAVGSSNSYADVAIFSLLKDCLDSEDSMKAAEKCDNLLSISKRISNDEKVLKWVENRPKTNF